VYRVYVDLTGFSVLLNYSFPNPLGLNNGAASADPSEPHAHSTETVRRCDRCLAPCRQGMRIVSTPCLHVASARSSSTPLGKATVRSNAGILPAARFAVVRTPFRLMFVAHVKHAIAHLDLQMPGVKPRTSPLRPRRPITSAGFKGD
jgi:hypothetical protein